jgi:hypothetical protein
MRKFFNNATEIFFNVIEVAFVILIPLSLILAVIHVIINALT